MLRWSSLKNKSDRKHGVNRHDFTVSFSSSSEWPTQALIFIGAQALLVSPAFCSHTIYQYCADALVKKFTHINQL